MLRSTVLVLMASSAIALRADSATAIRINRLTKERIQDRIKYITGLETVYPIESMERVSLSDLNIPFLAALLKDKTGIKVTFAPGKLKLPSLEPGWKDPYVRHFSVYFDEHANTFLAVTVRVDGEPPHPDADPEAAEADLRKDNELYKKFATIDPRVTFLKALDTCLSSGLGSPPVATEIDGIYIMYSQTGEVAHPVWMIRMRGLPPGRLASPYWRDAMDAMTGRPELSTNLPTIPSPRRASP